MAGKSRLTPKSLVIIILAGFFVIGGGVTIADRVFDHMEEEEYRRQETRREEEEQRQERMAAAAEEIVDDLGRLIFRRLPSTHNFGRFTYGDLVDYTYHPRKNRMAVDIKVNWQGGITGTGYWVLARAYLPKRLFEGRGSVKDVPYEIRAKSDSLIAFERRMGGAVLGLGVLDHLSGGQIERALK